MHRLNKIIRKFDTRQKFLAGLLFEKAGIAILNKKILPIETCKFLCIEIQKRINENPGLEHDFYKRGVTAFANQHIASDDQKTKMLEICTSTQRVHALITRGAILIKTGLGNLPKATILGAFLYCSCDNDYIDGSMED